eukprot:3817092-Pyramimonas_sp.AAC.1
MSLRFTGSPVRITARMHSTPRRPSTYYTIILRTIRSVLYVFVFANLGANSPPVSTRELTPPAQPNASPARATLPPARAISPPAYAISQLNASQLGALRVPLK